MLLECPGTFQCARARSDCRLLEVANLLRNVVVENLESPVVSGTAPACCAEFENREEQGHQGDRRITVWLWLESVPGEAGGGGAGGSAAEPITKVLV